MCILLVIMVDIMSPASSSISNIQVFVDLRWGFLVGVLWGFFCLFYFGFFPQIVFRKNYLKVLDLF